jgi:hypothetical protein
MSSRLFLSYYQLSLSYPARISDSPYARGYSMPDVVYCLLNTTLYFFTHVDRVIIRFKYVDDITDLFM